MGDFCNIVYSGVINCTLPNKVVYGETIFETGYSSNLYQLVLSWYTVSQPSVYHIRRKAWKFGNCFFFHTQKARTCLYQIQPIVSYGCEVWHNGKHRFRVEALHKRYMKHALVVKNQTSNLAVYGETGRYPMLTRQEQLVLGYWLKIISVPVNKSS